jgi:drug/metabolite transporter (DMT)-like permease
VIHITDNFKVIIGIVIAVVGLGVLVSSRRTRGFGQRKQAGALLLIAAAIFIAIGLGYDPRALLRQ